MTAELTIAKKFFDNVYGKRFVDQGNIRHDGREGHWLETQMDIIHNGNNAPDILGYEMKNQTTSKTTFGDWSPNEAVWNVNRGLSEGYYLPRSEFLRIFGKPNILKQNRHSWSGEPAPKYGIFNTFGQMLTFDDSNNLIAIYSYDNDSRFNKSDIIPVAMRNRPIVLARWYGFDLEAKLQNKFGVRGWFKCIKDMSGRYCEIAFAPPISYENWKRCIVSGSVFFDPGMYDGNSRPYSQWRANNAYWDNLITTRYNASNRHLVIP
ncbi:LlaMI family restriction endonuclease [Shewanella baltica]|uniref:LlaMI family restriction endonuclease n=1 Tax=Shewanella baltica TaxID=62322 RepID=UPI0039B06333